MNSQNTDRDLLIAALNKNQVTYSQVSKIAEELINGVLKLKTLPMEKEFVFEYMNKKVYIDLNALRIGGLKYLNNILIDDILTTDELNEVYKILDQLKNELLNKADKIHKHDIADVNNLQSTLNDKADKDHKHTITDVNNLQSTLNGKADKDHTHSSFNNLTLNGYTNMNLNVASSHNGYIWALRIFDNAINEGQNLIIGLGKSQSNGKCATLYYHYSETDPYLSLGLHTHDYNIVIHKHKIDINKPMNINSDITANDFITNNGISLTTHKHTVNDITDYKPYDDTELRTKLNACQTEMANKADKIHTHDIADITDYKPYDDTELRTLINGKTDKIHKHDIADVNNLQSTLNDKADKIHTHDDRYAPIISYPTIEDMMIEWSNIPNNSIIVTNQGADQWSSSFTFKGSLWRSLTFTVPKITQNYLWTRFQGDGDPWTTPSQWRKIPLLDLDSKLIPDMLPNHKHKISDITDYKAYDDTEIKTKLNACETEMANKADKDHKHNINDLDDVVTNINYSQFEYKIADLTLTTNPYMWGVTHQYYGSDAFQPSWKIIDKHTIRITMYQVTQDKPNLRIVLDNADETVIHNIEYELETNFAKPVLVNQSYVVYVDHATIDLSAINIYGN